MNRYTNLIVKLDILSLYLVFLSNGICFQIDNLSNKLLNFQTCQTLKAAYNHGQVVSKASFCVYIYVPHVYLYMIKHQYQL